MWKKNLLSLYIYNLIHNCTHSPSLSNLDNLLYLLTSETHSMVKDAMPSQAAYKLRATPANIEVSFLCAWLDTEI